DRSGPARIVATGAVLTLVSWAVLGLSPSLIALVAGVILLDFAMQAALVANQHVVFALKPEARARLNTILMGAMFLGGSAGSASGTAAWQAGGWPAVAGLGLLLGALASAIQVVALRRR
ncbi:MFS transporter, partial [Methylobacterium frigidaeris]